MLYLVFVRVFIVLFSWLVHGFSRMIPLHGQLSSSSSIVSLLTSKHSISIPHPIFSLVTHPTFPSRMAYAYYPCMFDFLISAFLPLYVFGIELATSTTLAPQIVILDPNLILIPSSLFVSSARADIAYGA